MNIVYVAFLVSEEYSITHYNCNRTRRQPATAIDQWLPMRRRLWIPSGPSDCWIRHFSSTANSKYRWRKNIRIREKNVYTAKLSGFKSFRIQNLRRHDQSGCFHFGFVLLCVNSKTNLVLKRSGFITNPEQFTLV